MNLPTAGPGEKLIDLHTHSTASDGSLRPAELVRAAQEAGLAAVALTDHDTVEGLDEFLAAGQGAPLETVPGVEISMQVSEVPLHLVGLYVDHLQEELRQGLSRLQQARADRNPKIVARLNELGIPLTLEEVKACSGGGQVGRPHFAQALVNRGAVHNIGEAFNRFLAAGKAAYVPKFRFKADEAIALIRSAGGAPILAHPGIAKLGWANLERLVGELKEMGLMGMEVYYSDHDPNITRRLAGLAARLRLLVSGGSDFHGEPKPAIALGRGKGGLAIPARLLIPIKRAVNHA
jgi:predicted metal-dependent phosphoesterase TrpH